MKAFLVAAAAAAALGTGTAALAQESPAPAPAPASTAGNILLADWTGPYDGVPPWDQVRPELFPAAFQAAIDALLRRGFPTGAAGGGTR